MASKKATLCLSTGLAGAAAFLAGKYQEKVVSSERINIPSRPALPIFAEISNNPTPENPIQYLQSLFQQILPKNCTIIHAASPITTTGDNKLYSSRVSQIMKYGYPGMDNIISYSDYVLSYDRRNRVAHWVFEHLTAESVKQNDEVDRSKCNFAEAEHVHPYFRSTNSDYKGSGYDRGHLAAAGNHKTNQKHVEETFYLTNMAPQVGKGFNRDSWNRLEKYVRKLTKTYSNVYCCTGPLYLPKKESNGKMYVKYEVIGAHHVAVPTHFYKVVVGETVEGILEMECFIMENAIIGDNIPIKSFQVPLELIERSAGLLFFDNVTKNRLYKINGKKT